MRILRNSAFLSMALLAAASFRAALWADTVYCTATWAGCDTACSTPDSADLCNEQCYSSTPGSLTHTCESYGCGYPYNRVTKSVDCGAAGCRPCTPGYVQFCQSNQQPISSDQCGCYVCGPTSPIIINLAQGGHPTLSNAAEGVQFDISAVSLAVWVAWPVDTSAGWLALDRNRNGIIDNGAELFGDATPLMSGGLARNGYEALAQYDSNGDGRIDATDPVFSDLRLWLDSTRDGRSDTLELHTLPSVGVLALETSARESGEQDRWGNRFKYRAKVIASEFNLARWSYDVYPVIAFEDAPR
jgi:hypothetical protein